MLLGTPHKLRGVLSVGFTLLGFGMNSFMPRTLTHDITARASTRDLYSCHAVVTTAQSC